MTAKPGGTTRHALLDHLPEMVTISDRDGRILYSNPATETVTGHTPEQLAAMHLFERIHPEDRPRCEEAFARLMSNPGLSLDLERRIKHKDGTWRWVEVNLASLFDDPGVGGLLATVRDVTERREAEKAVRESEEKYRTLFESVDEGFCIVEVIFDESGEPIDYRFLETNPAFRRHTGLHDAVGRRMRELEPRHEEHWFKIYGRIARTGEPERFQNTAEYLGGRIFDVYAFRIGAPGERKVAILFTDITRRREDEEERLRIRGLEASIRSEAAERQRIARELHDRVAHTMGVAHQSLQLHRAYAASDSERAAEKLELATDATRTALEQTRFLSAQLARRGAEETSEGLGTALGDLLDSYVPEGVETALSVEGDESAVPTSVADEAYLVVREAVRNAVEHSGCGRVTVSIEVREGDLQGRVEDDGTGFDPPRESPVGGRDDDENGGPTVVGMGLRSMRERVDMLGGRLGISSEPGRGTTVELRVPLED